MIVVAGHLCLDIFPSLKSGTEMRPGLLIEAGKAHLSTGGAVPNVGLALHKLGAHVRLVGKVGQDAFGKIALDLLNEYKLGNGIEIDPHGDTSYTVVVSPPGYDRTFLHCPGCNDTFVASDVHDSAFAEAKHLHFGYPPLMAAMSANDGDELVSLFTRARLLGLTTSLDMSLPDPDSQSGKLNWKRLLERVLPFVDIFLPSEDELAFMLPESRGAEALAKICLSMGAKTIVIKRGSQGLFGLTDWEALNVPCFPATIVGTTGSGDATIAGFLYALVQGLSFEKCLLSGCAVGACSVESPDAASGIPSWAEVQTRFKLAE